VGKIAIELLRGGLERNVGGKKTLTWHLKRSQQQREEKRDMDLKMQWGNWKNKIVGMGGKGRPKMQKKEKTIIYGSKSKWVLQDAWREAFKLKSRKCMGLGSLYLWMVHKGKIGYWGLQKAWVDKEKGKNFSDIESDKETGLSKGTLARKGRFLGGEGGTLKEIPYHSPSVGGGGYLRKTF